MTARAPRFVTVEQILRLHAYAIEDQGGDPSLRDRGLLESALAQPRQQFDGKHLHPTIPAMAAAYAFHICKNHPFVDGNKRAATAAMIKFLVDNGWSFDATADEAEPVILSLAAGNLSKEALTSWLEKHCHAKPSMELRDFFLSISGADLFAFMASALADHDEGVRTTVIEASMALPVIGELYHAAQQRIAAGDSFEDMRGDLATLRTLVFLYRLAEDQGYEW